MFFGGILDSSAQQKANDFTKRVQRLDGKMSSLSGRASKFNRLSPSSSRRISVEEWPSHFSPFGGKRFPMGNAKILGRERFTTTQIEIETPLNDQIAQENFKRATNQNLSKRDPAVNAVEFRDAYYARLNDRVDEWMDKVNNMSLQDINRYQFRRDRPSEPGFPVQRAGAAGTADALKQSPIQGSGLPSKRGQPIPAGNSNYWMGPKKITSSSATSQKRSGSEQSLSSSFQSSSSPEKFQASPKPILGPKTIRVEVGASE
jgi:hypothetical protein